MAPERSETGRAERIYLLREGHALGGVTATMTYVFLGFWPWFAWAVGIFILWSMSYWRQSKTVPSGGPVGASDDT